MKTGERVEIEVRRLRPEDERSEFSSGNADLDRFFRQYAGQNQFRRHIGSTFVAIADGVILGFFTVAASELTATRLPAARRKRLPLYPLPVLRLARLAVDERAQGRGIGSALLRAVFALAHRMADDFGCIGVVVDAKPEAVAFYERLGFMMLEAATEQPGPRSMFLELGAIPKPPVP
jgi:GNAT superfamily N-acetyltransferase